MGVNLEYVTLARLLTLNNQVHDLESQLLAVSLPTGLLSPGPASPNSSPIANIQEEIAQGVRASLAACWLGSPQEEGF